MSPHDAPTSTEGPSGLKPNAKGADRSLGRTPLEEAVACNDDARVVALLRRGESLRRSRGYRHVPLLLSAILHNRSEAVVRAMLEGGANPHERGRSCPPLHAAAQLKRPDLMQALIDHGARVGALHQGVPAAAWAGDDPHIQAILARAALDADLAPGQAERPRRF